MYLLVVFCHKKSYLFKDTYPTVYLRKNLIIKFTELSKASVRNDEDYFKGLI